MKGILIEILMQVLVAIESHHRDLRRSALDAGRASFGFSGEVSSQGAVRDEGIPGMAMPRTIYSSRALVAGRPAVMVK
jgi:hypothetical protein